jgi:flagellar protein FliO/FliZ
MKKNAIVVFSILILTAALFAQGTENAETSLPLVPAAPAEAETVSNPESALVLGDAPAAAAAGASQLGVIIRMVLVLALAAAAVYGVVYFLRRSARPQTQRNSHLKILTSAHLGSNRFVYVVSVGGRAWLIGAGEGGVTPIAEVEDQEAIDAMLLDESRSASETGASRFADFKALFRRLGGAKSNSAGTGGVFSVETLRKQREKLKGL